MLVMKRVTKSSPAEPGLLRPRRLSVAEAKAKLSEALRSIRNGPSIIHNRGRDVAVLIDVEQYDRLVAEQRAQQTQTPAQSFLARLEHIKQELGSGADGFAPRKIDYRPRNPFSIRAR
jgi:prevent-host-death family protein